MFKIDHLCWVQRHTANLLIFEYACFTQQSFQRFVLLREKVRIKILSHEIIRSGFYSRFGHAETQTYLTGPGNVTLIYFFNSNCVAGTQYDVS